ncbi:hypothetical protein ACA910_015054 [Epithemia clementina (nom. ined.)]
MYSYPESQHSEPLLIEQQSFQTSITTYAHKCVDDHYDHDDDDNSDKSVSDFRRCETIDAIEEEWEEPSETFRLHYNHLDRFSIAYLIQKWERMNFQRHVHGSPGKTIKKIVLDRCTFSCSVAVHLMIILMIKIGPELKQLSIHDGCAQTSKRKNEMPLGSLIGGLRFVHSLKSLVLERTDLRGHVNGLHLRHILARNTNLESLKLFGCTADSATLEHLLIGLNHHSGLQYLDVGGWGLSDDQVGCLISTLVHSKSCKKLKSLDISGSKIGEKSLTTLAHLLKNCFVLEGLILYSCDGLFREVRSDAPPYLEFVDAIKSTIKLKRVRFSQGYISPTLFETLDADLALRYIQFRFVDNNSLSTRALIQRLPASKKKRNGRAPCISPLALDIMKSGFSFFLGNL